MERRQGRFEDIPGVGERWYNMGIMTDNNIERLSEDYDEYVLARRFSFFEKEPLLKGMVVFSLWRGNRLDILEGFFKLSDEEREVELYDQDIVAVCANNIKMGIAKRSECDRFIKDVALCSYNVKTKYYEQDVPDSYVINWVNSIGYDLDFKVCS